MGEKVKLRFKGEYKSRVMAPGFIGVVEPGQVVEFDSSVLSDWGEHADWERVETKKAVKEQNDGN